MTAPIDASISTQADTSISTRDILRAAKKVRIAMAALPAYRRNEALEAMACEIESSCEAILAANAIDVEAARGTIGEVMLDRLSLSEARVRAMAQGVRDVAALPDPVGRVLDEREVADGLALKKVSVPLGVVAIIYESRPNVTSDAAALCVKSGNVCVLRGGKEAFRTSLAVVEAMRRGLAKVDVSEDAINIIMDTSRDSAVELMRANGLVDVLIPRGGAGLIRACLEQSTVPCIETGTGICSVYVDEAADLDMAVRIVVNAKTQRPSVCNACETCLVHSAIAPVFLPMLAKALIDERIERGLEPVQLRCDGGSLAVLADARAGVSASSIVEACDSDFDTEFLDYVLAIKLVDSVVEAVVHIDEHSTHHSESIVTRDMAAAEYFTSRIDSAALYVNASTRYTDGGMFGLGCEMGISTQKLHARGPMGLEELTSYKYIVTGNGQVRG